MEVEKAQSFAYHDFTTASWMSNQNTDTDVKR